MFVAITVLYCVVGNLIRHHNAVISGRTFMLSKYSHTFNLFGALKKQLGVWLSVEFKRQIGSPLFS